MNEDQVWLLLIFDEKERINSFNWQNHYEMCSWKTLNERDESL